MKTNSNFKELKSNIMQMVKIMVIILISLNGMKGQERNVFNHDYLMPKKGGTMVEFYSGIPYVAIGQFGYGFSDRFSVGVFYGYTPFEKGYGLRMKAIIAQPSESFRVNMKSIFIYYPGMKKVEGEPWVLAWPTVNGEWKLKNGSRIWAGVGLIGAASVDHLLGSEDDTTDELSPGPYPVWEETTTYTEDMELSSLFNTFQIGYSKPLSNRWSFVAEVAPVMEGFKLKSPNGFLDAMPVIITLGFSGSF